MSPSKTRTLSALLVLTLVLSACGSLRESRANPRNWFNPASSEPTLGPVRQTADSRPLVPEVSTMTVEQTSTGAIVRAAAVMPNAGYWNAALIPENDGRPRDGVISYRFVASPPREPVPLAGPGPRTITAAATLSVYDLEIIREVVVIGAQSTRRTRR